MAFFEDLINHPNFGKMFSSSPAWAESFLTRYMTQFPEELRKTSLNRMKISVDANNALKIRIQDDARVIEKRAGESNADYFNRAVQMTQSSRSRVRDYLGDVYKSTQTGPSMNRRLDALSEIHKVDFRVSSIPVKKGEDVADIIYEQIGSGGYIKIDPEVATVVEAFDKRTGKLLSRQQTLEILGYEFDKAKRWGALLNEAEAELTYKNGERVKVAMISPKDYFEADPKLAKRVRSYLKTLETKGSFITEDGITKLTGEDAIKYIYDIASDGSLLISEDGLNRVIGQMKGARDEVLKAGQLKGRSSPEYFDALRRADKMDEKIKEIKKASREGRSFNIRGLNGEDIFGSSVESIEFKGEALAIRREHFYDLLKKANPNITREEAAKVDVLLPSNNRTAAKVLTPQGGSPKPRVSSITLNIDPQPHVNPLSNTLTTATYGDIINVDNYLQQSLDAEINQLMKEIKAGNYSGGLKRLLRDIQSRPFDNLSNQEIAELESAQRFARRVQAFFDAGGDLRTDPYMTQQLVDQIEKHYFRLAKGSSKEGKGTYLFRGAQVDSLGARFPMRGGTRAHLRSEEMVRMRGGGTGTTGSLGVDNAGGRFGVSLVDAFQTRAAFGGFDFDDSFYGFYQYDQKTKRLLNFTLRDPNAMGEYFIFNADIANDTSIPEAIRELWKRRETQMKKLEKTINAQGGVKKKYSEDYLSRLINEINNLGDKLDDYFSGKTVNIAGENYVQDFIKNVDLEKLYRGAMPAPSGFRKSDQSIAEYMNYSRASLRRLDSSNSVEVAKKIAAERQAMMRTGASGSIFEFVGIEDVDGQLKFYNEYNQFFNMKSSADQVAKARKSIHELIKSGEYTSDQLIEELRFQASTNGTLGRAINQYTIIDSFISTHLDFAGTGNVDDRIKVKLRELLETHKMSRIDREVLIDAIVKDFDSGVIKLVEQSLPEDIAKLGRIIKELNQYAEDQKIDFKAGIDPIAFQERLKSDKDQVSILNQIFGGDETGYLLSETDDKAVQAKLFGQAYDLREKFRPQKAEMIDESRAALSELIGDDFSPQQLQKAQEIISDFEQSRNIAKSIWEQPLDTLQRILDSGDTSVIDYYHRQGIQMRTLAALEGADAKDVLAVARVLLDSGADLDVLYQSDPLLQFGGMNVVDIFSTAKNQVNVFQGIANARNIGDLTPFIDYDLTKSTFSFTDHAEKVINKRQRNILLVNKIREMMGVEQSGQYYDNLEQLHRIVTNQDQFTRFGIGGFLTPQEFIPQVVPQASYLDAPTSVQIPKQLGELNTAMRSAADETVEEVVKSGEHLATRIKQLHVSDLISSKAARRGMVAIAAFAGVGIIHKIVTGDRTVDEANPYPLIPQNSKYERIADKLDYQQTPMVQNGSMTYKIRAHGTVDPALLSNAIQGVLPQGNTTIYGSRAYQMDNYGSDSRSILDQRLGL